MRPPLRTACLAAAASLIAVAGLNACAARSLDSQADNLAQDLRELPGVTDVELLYTKPITLDSGKLSLTVTLDPTASPDQVVEVVSATYAEFSSTHNSEEGDLDVMWGPDTLHLRSFSSNASTDTVTEASTVALGVLSDHRALDATQPERRASHIRIDLTTQDVEEAPHVATDIDLTLEATGRAVILDEFATLEQRHPDLDQVGWRISSGGNPEVSDAAAWELGTIEGFPPAKTRALFVDLGDELPRGSTVALIDDFPHVTLPSSAARSGSEASNVVDRHVALLGGYDEAYYDLSVAGTQVFSVMSGDCWFDTGTIGRALEKSHADQCRTVIPNE